MKTRSAVAALVSLSCLVVLVPPARADYDPLASGATKLNLDKGFLRALGQNGVKLRATGGASLKAGAVTFPVSGGKFDPTNAKGTIEHDGALVLSDAHGSIPIKSLQLKTTQRHSPFSAKLGGGQLKLASTTSLTTTRRGFGVKISTTKLALSAKVAGRLGKKLHLPGVFAQGLPFASSSTTGQPETITVLGRGRGELALDPAFAAKLQSLSVAVNPIFPVEHIGSVFTLPIFGGTIAPDASLGRVETLGSLEFLQLGGGQVIWHESRLDLGARATSAEVDVEPSPPYAGMAGRVEIAPLSLVAPAISNAKARTVTVEPAALTLPASTAATFNEVFARPQGTDGVFVSGEMLGSIVLTAQGQ